MNFNTADFNKIFQEAIKNYHLKDNVYQEFSNIYKKNSFKALLYKKCWIDTVQWHLEDIIRDPNINPETAIKIKRKIDKSNQKRTDLVENIDDYIYNEFKNVKIKENARINTESPGWAIDRLSILNLKIYHWKEETLRKDASEEHIKKAGNKLNILQTQFDFLNEAIDKLIFDIANGNVIAQTFKQMKMYNDPETNPILRATKK